tara:strand:+ start:9408 stop:10730 length:1323 start_codon:yes stop_codon:yes gene_type:complete
MSDLKEALDKAYKKQNAKITVDALTGMINEALDAVYDEVVAKPAVKEARLKKEQAKTFMLSLPKFTPSEAWGDPNSMERQQIQQIFNVIGGERTIKAKLGFLQRIASPDNRIRSPRRIISSLIILESLSAVINSFNSSSAGFVFEGFLAALFQGAQEAGVDTTAGSLPIEDLIAFSDTDKAVPISLKLLNQTTQVEGSYTNLIDGLSKFGHMVYLVARKDSDGSGINIEQFTLDKDNFVKALSQSARGGSKKGASVFQIVDHPDLGTLNVAQSLQLLNSIVSKDNPQEWEKKYDILQHTKGYSGKVRDKRKREKEAAALKAAQSEGGLDMDSQTSLQESKGGTQWSISPAQLVSFDFVEYDHLGELKYSEEELKKTAEMHMAKLDEELLVLFEATQGLSEHVNEYFTYEKRSKAISSGEKAIQDTVTIQKSLTAQISADK